MAHVPKPRTTLTSRTDVRTLRRGVKRYTRQRYLKYNCYSDEIKQIQNLLQNPKYGDCSYIAYYHKFPSSTVRTWKSKIQHDPSYNIQVGYKSKRRSIFTKDEESALADYIRVNIIDTGQLFTDQDFRVLCMQAFLEKYQDSEKIPKFNCSNGFIYDFKKRNRFSSRRGHAKRRPAANQEEIDKWKQKIRKLLKTVDKDHIANVDETSWFFYPRGLLTWAQKGAKNVSFQIDGNDKDNLTALCAITASGTKLPMMIIAAGKTTRVEETQLGDIFPHWPAHSESGWTTEEVFTQYLQNISNHFHGEEVHLLLDVYTAHRTDDVKAIAKALNIHLYYIPPGCTDLVQPLDVKVFGALKAKARALFRKRYEGTQSPHVTSKDAVQNLIRAWEGLSNEVAEEAWYVYDENSDSS